MPGKEYYEALPTLAERVGALADYHIAPANRHISDYEYKLLCTAVARLEGDAKAMRHLAKALHSLGATLPLATLEQ
jgi:hypothetical protein